MSKVKNFPVQIIWVEKSQQPAIKYSCPDCGKDMIRVDRTHSPTVICYHSICSECTVEWCDYYGAYCKKPKNPKAILKKYVRPKS